MASSEEGRASGGHTDGTGSNESTARDSGGRSAGSRASSADTERASGNHTGGEGGRNSRASGGRTAGSRAGGGGTAYTESSGSGGGQRGGANIVVDENAIDRLTGDFIGLQQALQDGLEALRHDTLDLLLESAGQAAEAFAAANESNFTQLAAVIEMIASGQGEGGMAGALIKVGEEFHSSDNSMASG